MADWIDELRSVADSARTEVADRVAAGEGPRRLDALAILIEAEPWTGTTSTRLPVRTVSR